MPSSAIMLLCVMPNHSQYNKAAARIITTTRDGCPLSAAVIVSLGTAARPMAYPGGCDQSESPMFQSSTGHERTGSRGMSTISRTTYIGFRWLSW